MELLAHGIFTLDQTPNDQVPYNDDFDDEDVDYDLDNLDEDEDDEDEDDAMEEDSRCGMIPIIPCGPSHVFHSRFQEITAELEKETKEVSKKRQRDSDSSEEKLSKSEKKKLSKKLKAEGGKAIPAGTEEKPQSNGEVKKGKEHKEKEKSKDKSKMDKAEKGVEKEKKTTREVQGVKITDVKIGTGRQAKAGDTVSMRYIGKLTNGKVFDKNTGGAPVSNALLRV